MSMSMSMSMSMCGAHGGFTKVKSGDLENNSPRLCRHAGCDSDCWLRLNSNAE